MANDKEVNVRSRSLLAVAVLFTLTAAVLAQGGDAKPKVGAKSPADRLVIVPGEDLKWTDLDPAGAPGVKVADLWGDHTKGAYGAFFKLPAGFASPLHTHTHDMKVVIVSGTYIQIPQGKPEIRLGPWSYFLQPGGNYRHTTGCDRRAECVFFAESNGKFDFKVVTEGKAPAKK
jgi:hypothetical protein